jgi:hypothetical protein
MVAKTKRHQTAESKVIPTRNTVFIDLSPSHCRSDSTFSTASTVVSRHDSRRSVSTYTPSDGIAPPPSSLEYYSFLVKVWTEKAQAERRDLRRIPYSWDLERAPKEDLPATIPEIPIEKQNPPIVAVCTKEDLRPIYDPDYELKKISRRLLRCQKYALAISLISTNATLIFASW